MDKRNKAISILLKIPEFRLKYIEQQLKGSKLDFIKKGTIITIGYPEMKCAIKLSKFIN